MRLSKVPLVDARSSFFHAFAVRTDQASTWLGRLESLCVAVGASMIRRLVTGGPQTCDEKANARWLRDPLLRRVCLSSVRKGAALAADDSTAIVASSPEGTTKHSGSAQIGGDLFFVSAARSPQASLEEQLRGRFRRKEACALSAAMKRVVLEDRGRDEGTNEAVWATAAAVLHHSGLTGEAERVAKAEVEGGEIPPAASDTGGAKGRRKISPALVQAWRSAQQARLWLEGDELPGGEQSLLVSRAAFLLCLTPWASMKVEAADDRPRIVLQQTASATELVLKFLLRPYGACLPLSGHGGDGEASPKDNAVKSTEDPQVGEPSTLLRVIEQRVIRARARAQGFWLAERLLNGVGSERSTREALRAIADGLAAACLAGADFTIAKDGISVENVSRSGDMSSAVDGDDVLDVKRLHFMSGVELCDARSKSKLIESVARFLKQCSSVVRRNLCVGVGLDRSALTYPASDRRAVLVYALCAVCMDYGWEDHDLLQSSQLLPLMSRLMDDAEPAVAAAASEVLQALYRAARMTGGKAVWRGSTTPFQSSFCGTIRRKLQMVASGLKKKKSLVTADIAPESSPIVPLENTLIPLRSDQAGLVVPHYPIGAQHSLSLWVFIPQTSAVRDREQPADPTGSTASTDPSSYVVVEGARCVVQISPSLSSEEVGVLNAGDTIKVAPPEPRWARHPLVTEGRRVRLTSPIKGYTSVYTAGGSSLLELRSTQSRRSACDSNLDERVVTSNVAHVAANTSRGAEEEARLPRTLFWPVSHEQKEAVPKPRSSEPGLRADRTGGVGQCDMVLPERAPPLRTAPSFAGGILVLKGNQVLLGQSEAPCSWTQFGLEVTTTGALRYFVGEGGVAEAAVTSHEGSLFGAMDRHGDELGVNRDRARRPGDKGTLSGWFHVAVVQDQLDVSLFVNGRQCGHGALPRHLLKPSHPQYRTAVRQVESAHPYPQATDECWFVHIPGATRVTVRFDPRSKTKLDPDFVRFYKDRTKTQV